MMSSIPASSRLMQVPQGHVGVPSAFPQTAGPLAGTMSNQQVNGTPTLDYAVFA